MTGSKQILAILNAIVPSFSRNSPFSLLDNSFFLHAISTPLTEIGINLELSMLENKPDRQQQHLANALLSTEHLQNLFKQLLRPTTQSRYCFYANSALRDISLRYHQPHHSRFLSSLLHISERVKIKGNQFYFQEALSLLLNNSYEAYTHQRHPRHVWLAATHAKSHLTIHIGDAGKGINWLSRHLIFVKGFSSKRHGTGLGLSYCRYIIEKHLQGSLKLASSPGMGTVWVIKIPTMS